MTTLAEVLREQGHDLREARKLAGQGRVWLGHTPVTDMGREVDEREVRVLMSRPAHAPGRDAAVVVHDDRLAVVYKPSGLLSVPAPGRREPSVLSQVSRWLGHALAVHRIDEGTSGLLLVARDVGAQLDLKNQLEAHSVERRYLALVRGRFPGGEKRVDAPLGRMGDGRRGIVAGGKPAITRLRAVDTCGDVSVVEARLETGRTHQVRLHLAHLGFPILGDDLYGGARFARLALHAHVIGFRHPAGDTRRYVSPLPDELWRRCVGSGGGSRPSR